MENAHIVICRGSDWKVSRASAIYLEEIGAIWVDHDANARDPKNTYYGVTGEISSKEELLNISLVIQESRNG